MKEKWFKDRKVPEEKRFRWSQITQHASLSLLTRVGVVLGVTMETAEGSSVEVKKEGEDEWIAGVKRNHSSTGSPRCGASGRAVVCHNGRTSRDEICIFMSITHTHTHMLTSSFGFKVIASTLLVTVEWGWNNKPLNDEFLVSWRLTKMQICE